jgi:hypothetical protein
MHTFLLYPVDEALHGQNREISVEDLNRIVEDFALDCLSLCVLFVVFGVYLSVTLSKEGGVVFVDEILRLFFLHWIAAIIRGTFFYMSDRR